MKNYHIAGSLLLAIAGQIALNSSALAIISQSEGRPAAPTPVPNVISGNAHRAESLPSPVPVPVPIPVPVPVPTPNPPSPSPPMPGQPSPNPSPAPQVPKIEDPKPPMPRIPELKPAPLPDPEAL